MSDTILESPDILLDFKFNINDCIIPAIRTFSDESGNFSIPYNWFGETTKIINTNNDGNLLGVMIVNSKRKIVAKRPKEIYKDYTEYLIGIDSITPTPNKRINKKIIMKSIRVKK